MLTSSIYCAMLITNWGGTVNDKASYSIYVPSIVSYWVKICVSWASALIYVWTLVAPRLFPDRDFS